MRRNLWLPFQLTLVNTLCMGVGVRPTNVLSIDQHMIDQRAQSSIHPLIRKNLELDLILVILRYFQ